MPILFQMLSTLVFLSYLNNMYKLPLSHFSKKREVVPDLAPMLWHSFGKLEQLFAPLPFINVLIAWCNMYFLLHKKQVLLQVVHGSVLPLVQSGIFLHFIFSM